MTAKEVLENLISTIEKNSKNNKATITNVDLWAKSWRRELNQVNNIVLDDVSKATCKNCGRTKDKHTEASMMCPNMFNFFEVDC